MIESSDTQLIRPVILSGGAGTRLWPVSRLAFPKQLLPIAADQSMLQVTALRATGPRFSAPVIVGDEEHRFFIGDQLERSNLTPPQSSSSPTPATRPRQLAWRQAGSARIAVTICCWSFPRIM